MPEPPLNQPKRIPMALVALGITGDERPPTELLQAGRVVDRERPTVPAVGPFSNATRPRPPSTASGPLRPGGDGKASPPGGLHGKGV